MSEDNAIARPYAKAAFDFAVKNNQVEQWSAFLRILATVANDPRIKGLIKNPKVHSDKILALFKDIASVQSNKHVGNFLGLLAYYKRLLVLPAIYVLFEAYRALQEQQVVAIVTSAESMTEQQQQRLQQALVKRFAKQVIVHYQQDKNLIGGAVIRVGDTVIDGSVQGKLHRLTQHLEMREKICQ